MAIESVTEESGVKYTTYTNGWTRIEFDLTVNREIVLPLHEMLVEKFEAEEIRCGLCRFEMPEGFPYLWVDAWLDSDGSLYDFLGTSAREEWVELSHCVLCGAIDGIKCGEGCWEERECSCEEEA